MLPVGPNNMSLIIIHLENACVTVTQTGKPDLLSKRKFNYSKFGIANELVN